MSGHAPPPSKRNRGSRPPGRRGARRPHDPGRHGEAAPVIDPSADEAIWFEPAWRDGRNAVRLLETLGILAGGGALPEPLRSALGKTPDEASSADYAVVDVFGAEATLLAGVDGIVFPAAAGCLANWLARSHAGGVVPNVFLRGVTGWLLWRGLVPTDAVRWEVGRARARDLGLDDALTAEFMRLWHGRRYHAALAVGAASTRR